MAEFGTMGFGLAALGGMAIRKKKKKQDGTQRQEN